jgi:hypothetical protein
MGPAEGATSSSYQHSRSRPLRPSARASFSWADNYTPVPWEGRANVAPRWLAYEWPRHEFAFSVLAITVRVLVITLPLLLLAMAAFIAGGSEDDDPGPPDLVGIMLLQVVG